MKTCAEAKAFLYRLGWAPQYILHDNCTLYVASKSTIKLLFAPTTLPESVQALSQDT